MDINAVDNKLANLRDSIIKIETKLETALHKLAEAEKRVEQYEQTIIENDSVAKLLRATSEWAKKQMKGRIEAIVSSALNIVYGGEHSFTIEFVDRRNQVECDYFLDDGFTKIQLKRPFVGKGGGKITVAALALQIAILEEARFSGPLLLDEVTKMVDLTAVKNVAYFLKEYSVKFNRQIINVTHHEAIADASDKAYEVKKVDGVASTNEVV